MRSGSLPGIPPRAVTPISGMRTLCSAWPFARYGQTLEDFGRYVRNGVNIGMGTDVAPHNLIEEMRLAATLARVAAEDITATSLTEVFHAATACRWSIV
jgi:5-methylthioadenosine/S-adenosylhomocysteine deaminase